MNANIQGEFKMKKMVIKAAVLIAASVSFVPAAYADVSANQVKVTSVRPLANANRAVVAVTPAAQLCGGTKSTFYITNMDAFDGKNLYAALLTAMAADIAMTVQVAAADCGETWPDLAGISLKP